MDATRPAMPPTRKHQALRVVRQAARWVEPLLRIIDLGWITVIGAAIVTASWAPLAVGFILGIAAVLVAVFPGERWRKWRVRLGSLIEIVGWILILIRISTYL